MLFKTIWAMMLNNRAKKDSQKVLDCLNIQLGCIIADIGSGGGFFTFEFSKRTGLGGKVFAADSDKKLLIYIENISIKKKINNIETVICKEDECLIPKESCDLIFMRSIFHHIKNSKSYFLKLRESIKPGGRIAIIEWKNDGRGFVGRLGHCAEETEIIRIMNEAGFSHYKTFDFLPEQSFNIFIRSI